MLYHGTCTSFEQSIKKHGLRPMPSNKYVAGSDSDTYEDLQEENGVYLTPEKLVARCFAQFRADWMRAKIGDVVFYNGVNPKQKLGGPIVANTKPLLVTITHPIPLKHDPNDGIHNESQGLYWTDKVIPLPDIRLTVMPDKPNGLIQDAEIPESFSSLREYQEFYAQTMFPHAHVFTL